MYCFCFFLYHKMYPFNLGICNEALIFRGVLGGCMFFLRFLLFFVEKSLCGIE